MIAFSFLYPLFFQNSSFFFYYTSSFLVPLITPVAFTLRPKIQIFYPIVFTILSIININKINELLPNQQLFYYAYALTVLLITQMLSFAEFKTRLEKLALSEERNKMIEKKSSLLQIVSHDVSNPLMIILLHAKSVITKLNSAPQMTDNIIRTQLDKIEGSAEDIKEIINRVREIEAHSFSDQKIELRPVQASSVINNACDLFYDRFIEKGVTLINESSTDINDLIYIDESILKFNVIPNLLSNALKFSSKGDCVQIGTHISNDEIHIYIKDNGAGIPVDMRENLFLSKVKTTTIGTDGEKGTGFGMPLAFLYTEQMDGVLSFKTNTIGEDEAEQGTTFFLKFTAA
jgi:signal transduction histidine kinase